MKPALLAQLLDRAHQDRLPILGVGLAAQTRAWGRYAVKIAHPGAQKRVQLKEEVENLELARAFKALGAPRLYGHDDGALVRARLPGEIGVCGLEDQLLLMIDADRRFADLHGRHLDISPANVVAHRGRLRLFDLGTRLDPPLFRSVTTRADLDRALARYRDRRAPPIAPIAWPPSGACHVEVDVGEARGGAKLLWANRRAIGRLKLEINDADLMRFGASSTLSDEKRGTLVATRYQDSPAIGAGHAQGDGRALWLGRHRDLDLVVKGTGPTPLIWKGNKYHEDGLVSFQRTLWETTVCDELARIGITTPEVLALYDAGATTIDNTDIEWPAAMALRAAGTQLRLGHLMRFQDEPRAQASLLEVAGIDVAKVSQVRAFIRAFSENLGHDTGLTDALNVHCFNPTVGNVRVDGHFIDFSTVRFFDRYLPDFRYMNATRAVKEHRAAWRQMVTFMVDALKGVSSLQRELRAFDRAYERGYVDGLLRYLGAPRAHVDRRADLVRIVRRARALRSTTTKRFPFWKQEVPAPLIVVEKNLARYHDTPRWTSLVDDARSITRQEERALDMFDDRVAGLVAAPQTHATLFRPFVEPERLAELCYHRSRPDRFDDWKVLMASRREHEGRGFALVDSPEGRVRCRGLSEEMAHALANDIGGILGEHFVALDFVDGEPFSVRVVHEEMDARELNLALKVIARRAAELGAPPNVDLEFATTKARRRPTRRR